MPNRRFGQRGKQRCITCNCTCVDDYYSDSDFGSDYEDFLADLNARKESFRRLYEHRSLDEIELEIQKCDVVLDRLNSLPDDEIFESKNINFGNITRQKKYALRDIKDSRLKYKTKSEPSNITETPKKKKKKKKNRKKPTDPISVPCNTHKGTSALTCDVDFDLLSAQNTTPINSFTNSALPVTAPVKPMLTEPHKTERDLPIKTRNLKVTVKGLPIDFTSDGLKSALQEKDFHCVKVVQFKKRTSLSDDPPTYRDLPIFLLILPDSSHHRLIYNLDKILDFDIQIERYRGGQQQIQCYKCQRFGHAQHCCNSQLRCMKCAGLHLSFQCDKDPASPPKCCNCGMAHPANYIGCEARIQATLSMKKISTSMDKTSQLIRTLEELKLLDSKAVEFLRALLCSSNV